MDLQPIPEILIIEETENELEPLYRILIHNDHVTPMDFVIQILKSVFMLGRTKAVDIMLRAHVLGEAYVQTVPRSEAERRITQAHDTARLAGYPLHFSMEAE
jgi:ATP-dependent Clp protease adaptor protein ClpS